MNVKRNRKSKKPHTPPNLLLEEVIGLTAKNGNGLAASVSSSKFAYIAGCVVVLYDLDSGAQSQLMVSNRKTKPLSCVALSCDASVVAAGERGHQPAVLIWDLKTLSLSCELKGHQYGVACISLSSDGKHLVSAGFPRDEYICLWNWQRKTLVTKVKESSLSSTVTSIAFSSDAKFLLTAGGNDLKYWKIGWSARSRASFKSVTLAMHKKLDFGHCKDGLFVAVASPCRSSQSSGNHIQAGELPFYVLTNKGTLCSIYPGSSTIKSVELQVEKCFALSTSYSFIACGCNNGVVKLFSRSLTYVCDLCYNEARRCNGSNVADCQSDVKEDEHPNWPTLPDAIALVIYDDRSLYVWDILDIHKPTRCCVLVSHSGCIWGIKNVPCENMHAPSLLCAAKGCSGGFSFATCSTDGTIRMWDLALQPALAESSSSVDTEDVSTGTTCLVNAGIFERDAVAFGAPSPVFRSMAVSSDGRHLAAGDSRGNLHVFNLYTYDYTFIQDAHDTEIISLSFNLESWKNNVPTEDSESRVCLASGARDGTVHLFDVHRNFNLIGSIDCHSSAVTAVKVASNGCKILSCGADGSLVLNNVVVRSKGYDIPFCQRIATSSTTYDMDVDSQMELALTVGQDKKIRAFNIQSGGLVKSFNQDQDFGDPVKITTDGSCSYFACSYSYGCICIYDYITGEMVARATGHGDLITGIIFLSDFKRLVSVAADGCIFVWRLPKLLTSKMLQRTNELFFQYSPENINQPMPRNWIESYRGNDYKLKSSNEETSANDNEKQNCEKLFFEESSSPSAAFRFSISRLPKWAHSKVGPQNLASSVETSSLKDSACHESVSLSRKSGKKFSGTLSTSSPETDSSSQGSPILPETLRYGMDARWLTVHTVCMGLLDSPESSDAKSVIVSGTSTDSTSRDQDKATTRVSKRRKLSPTKNGPFEMSKDLGTGCTDNIWPSEPYFCLTDDIHNMSESLQVTKAHTDAVTSVPYSQENDFFEASFGSLSAQTKTDKIKSSARRSSYLSRFLVRRDLLEGRKIFADKQARDAAYGYLIDTKEPSDFMALNPSQPLRHGFHMSESGEKANILDSGNRSLTKLRQTSNNPLTDSLETPASVTDSEIPLETNVIDIKEEKIDHGELELDEVETVSVCEKALHDLEFAAENALQSFSKLTNLKNGKEKLTGMKFLVCTGQAAARVPSIARKVEAIAKLLQPASNLSKYNLRSVLQPLFPSSRTYSSDFKHL
ncbi:mitogen-activated protein kinase-binding protein 1 [Dorcoceras hygrometricum]|uniref:Mitogen-activated protein kinase-binding protein 1 n=1 Tax=Dorcoceras hygrometricum TaxID=472368 RepID=A0A2Z7BYB3_9LAMI|nr:mitogen-activated protein kinase-binding protein 1 [Dorcoceras hygrometricum]